MQRDTATSPPGVIPFHRPARLFPEPIPAEPIQVAPPPTIPDRARGTWLQLMLPIVGSMGMLGFALIYRNVLFIAVAGGIAFLMALLWIGIRVQQGREARRRRRENAGKYREYLDRERQQIEEVATAQRRSLERLHPGPEGLWPVVSGRSSLWERRPDDHDFLQIRVGLGDVPLAVPLRLDLGTNPLVEYEAHLLEAARQLVGAFERLPLAPVTVPGRDLGSLAVVGEPQAARSLVRAVLCEMASFHAPDDLRMVAAFPRDSESHWGWMKWLPHTRESSVRAAEDGGRHAVALTADPEDLDVLLGQLVRPRVEHLERVRDAGPAAAEVRFQQAVVLVDGYRPDSEVGRLPVLDELLGRAAEVGVLLMVLVERAEDVPATVGARVELGQGGWFDYVEAGPDGRREYRVRADAGEVELCEALSRAMAPLRLRSRSGRTATVDSEGLLDLLGLGGEDVDPRSTWTARPPAQLLRTPIGVADDGTPAVLDVKEAAEGGMGPHGLVVGATGSGKSELLRTLVTGLAVTHAPEELAFVLVDYKGGATFAELDALPHTAGMITNLERDLTLVDRMHEALFGELERRQRLLQDAGHLDRVRAYQDHRAAHPDLELPALPSLLLVVDEFGELLTNRPDFLDLFVSIGRTGRSLGVHLLLATQRLDEGRIRGLEGHLRYRVCLRTFSADESLVALGSRDAFELPPIPGLGFLKVDAAVQRFKAALATRSHRQNRAYAEEPEVVRAFTATGPAAQLAVVGDGDRTEPEASEIGRGRSEMRVAVDALARKTDPGRQVRRVWLPPLPAALSLDAVLDQDGHEPGSPGWLRVPIGLLDRPREQLQAPFQLSFAGTGGHLAVIGAPRSGKSTLLQTVVGALALTHDPGDVQVYAVDLGGGGMHVLSGVPHLGAVYGPGEREEIHRVIRELRGIVEDRARAFRGHRLDGMAAYHQSRRDGNIGEARYGEVFVVIDNWARFAQEFEELEREVVDLAAAGLHYGVHLMVAGNRWNDIRLALRDNIGGRLELRLNDPIESEIDRNAAKALPDETPGRGITRTGQQFHAALPRVDGRADVGALTVGIEGLVAQVGDRWGSSSPAPPIRMLPLEVRPDALPDPAVDDQPGVAIGIEEFGLEPVRVDLFGPDPHFVVYGDGESGKTTLLRGWAQRMAAAYPPDRVRIALVDYRRTLLGAVGEEHLFGYACTPQMTAELAARLSAELRGRLPSPDLGPADLEARQWWSGPAVVLFVDDYDLVAGPAGNPLGELVDLVAQGRDVGFHVVLARRVGGAARSAFEPFFQRIRELGSPGLVMSGDPQEGPLIGDRKAEPMPPGRGYLVRRRRSALIHTAREPQVQTRPATRPRSRKAAKR
jgi:DNA segregation ATPase FtsK/SpoIIIE, S-DNA-T family